MGIVQRIRSQYCSVIGPSVFVGASVVYILSADCHGHKCVEGNDQMEDIFNFDSSDRSLVQTTHCLTLKILAALYVPSARDVYFVRLL
jgi:hypothetical protein